MNQNEYTKQIICKEIKRLIDKYEKWSNHSDPNIAKIIMNAKQQSYKLIAQDLKQLYQYIERA